jgi:peptidoglycan/LPS O-acetylase OafA/YrhL
VEKQNFLPRIESLRGIAALMVVGYHVNAQLLAGPAYGWFDDFAYLLFAAISNGIGAVVIFFVLSGFVLARSLDANSDPIRFFRNRFFRLFPAAVAVIALLTFLHRLFGIYVGFEASFDPANVVLNMLMIKSDINGVMWSMTVECAAAPLILLSVWLFQKHGEQSLWALIAVLFALSFWGSYVHLLGGFTTLAPFYGFVIGVLIHFRGQRISSVIEPKLAAIVAIVVFCFCGPRKQTAPLLMLECLSAGTLTALIAWRLTLSLFNPLDFGLVRFYGRISYSFYLLHPLGVLFFFRILDPREWGAPLFVTAAVSTVVSILLTTPFAYASWRFIEAPAIKLGKAFGNRFRRRQIIRKM